MFHILIVDDDKTVRYVMKEIVESAGYIAFPAKSGEEAFEILAREHIDLAIVDIMMPKQNGYELYLVDHGNPSPLCDDKIQGGFAEALANLYSAAAESCQHIKINANTRAIIDAYMTGITGTSDDIEIPF